MSLFVAGCSKGDGAEQGGIDAKHSYTMWIAQGEDSSYYSSYNDNPSIQYMLTKTWKDENDKDTKISLDIQVPATGTAKDNLNTMISTGDYTDVLDISMYTGSIIDLYEQGIVQDLTPYVEKYMPNYLKFLDANPDYKKTTMTLVNGQPKYLTLTSYRKKLDDQWGGYMYRRDWIVKYGKSPSDSSAFTGEYTAKNDDGSINLDSWKDNVVFPSGGTDPIYISDWEWMFEIFQTALKDQGISDGYCMSLYYPGYLQTGDLVSSFGGSSATWFLNKEGKAEFGMTSDNFRTYLQCMNTWYKNGWIDKAFPEHASNQFYEIDDAKVRQGKVGLWYGLQSQLAGKSDIGEHFTKGAVVYGARKPINDAYGSEAQKNIEPYCFYQQGLEGSSYVITDNAAEKDMIALLRFLDYTYSDEGMLLKSTGLNKEQYNATQNAFYSEYGLTEGAYNVSTEKMLMDFMK